MSEVHLLRLAVGLQTWVNPHTAPSSANISLITAERGKHEVAILQHRRILQVIERMAVNAKGRMQARRSYAAANVGSPDFGAVV